ncbi:polyphosphate kinase 1 [Methanofollis fontis]|uniref:Polyphosphate kinase n=1 Tax=Methanofollis fontis TaxID=2052832 RepID=A0A483CRL9_9EURY|nr:polyphosphate kinase 1 [Methanofollis fontis]TAJ43674.1 polyphosphate kinase 1 [Methanofollis fontis]
MEEAITPGDPALYINRELSWIEFNRRVLEEAFDDTHPLLERVKFLSIFSSNLDEFFMIRVAGLRRQIICGALEAPPDGMSPQEQMEAIRARVLPLMEEQRRCWHEALLPALREAGIHIRRYGDLDGDERAALRRLFTEEIFPVLTPMVIDPSHPFPAISNLSLNLAVAVRDPVRGVRALARVKVPAGLVPRLVRIPGRQGHTVFIEEVVEANLDLLFVGMEIEGCHTFRVTRDADIEIEEDEASDLLTAIEEGMEVRRRGAPARLAVTTAMPEWIRERLAAYLGLPPVQVYTLDPPIGMADLMEIAGTDRPDLRDTPFLPAVPALFNRAGPVLPRLEDTDLLLYHPYDSFAPVVAVIREAAQDPDVLAIKQTLYRAGSNSPIVAALMEARQNGKQVTAIIELKARFDEENNIGWARALERAGVHVVYGIMGLKVHAKVCLIVRRAGGRIVRHVHLGTGNYNAGTAKIYTDIGYWTTDPSIATDVSDLFNVLTGLSRKGRYEKLLVAPLSMRQGILERIEKEIERRRSGGDGWCAFKMNALVDQEIIDALYRASQAGVRIDLQVRGICCLRPGLPGISETITVTSIVGRFLEHVRIYAFGSGEVLVGSADLMPRNLDRRVEVLFPIDDPGVREAVLRLLRVHLADDVRARRLLPDGAYERPLNGTCDAQAWMVGHRGCWREDGEQ